MPARTHDRRGKRLRQMLGAVPDIDVSGIPDMLVSDLTLDSRAVRPGAAFVALPGARTHGIHHVGQALAAGAGAILWEPTEGVPAPEAPAGVASIAVPRLTQQLGALADRYFDAPSRSVRVVGVTGTNGKTTTAHLIAAALEQLGERSAYAGTLGVGRIGALRDATHTTPDVITTHRRLAELREQNVRSLAMEVSSHALDQHRVDGVRFDSAVFTNLTHDHLDYHGTLQAYGAAKARLFAWPGLRHALVNVEDPFGRELAGFIANGTLADTSLGVASRASAAAAHDARAAGPRLLRYCRGPASAPAGAAAGATDDPAAAAGSASRDSQTARDTDEARCLYARAVTTAPAGLCIEIDGSWGLAMLRSRFIGAFNVDNLLAALGALLSWDVPLREAVAALERCTAPPGRMETLVVDGGPLAIVDYAHTPDALEKVLTAARAHCTGRLTCVFGCGGDRDARKRPVMGAIAERLADVAIVTDDNPRTEDGDAIVAAILAGMRDPARALVERDRAAAIARALRESAAGDAVLIAGKGHEDYQIVGAERRAFSDREVARAALAERASAQGRSSDQGTSSGPGRSSGSGRSPGPGEQS